MKIHITLWNETQFGLAIFNLCLDTWDVLSSSDIGRASEEVMYSEICHVSIHKGNSSKQIEFYILISVYRNQMNENERKREIFIYGSANQELTKFKHNT